MQKIYINILLVHSTFHTGYVEKKFQIKNVPHIINDEFTT